MKKVLLASCAVALLTACSNDEVVQVNNDANAISFGVTAENNSRAADVYCNSNLFSDFNVFATVGDNVFINKAVVTGPIWTSDKTYYWPTEETVKFVGYKNWALDVNTTTAPQFTEFAPAANVGEQVDLVYAVKSQAKSAGSKVTMNFRHALSQIVFNARNDNDNLRVEISGVSVMNVKGQGDYILPTGDTDGNLVHNYGDATDLQAGQVGTYDETAVRGSWSYADVEATSAYEVNFNAVTVEGNKTAVNLTDWTKHNAAGSEFGDKGNALLLIPQTTQKYVVGKTDEAAEGVEGEATTYVREGSYFLVNCKISYVDTDEEGNEYVTTLWDKGNVMVPVDFSWQEGKKYLYTFVFGNGNGGYDPDPENPTPDPVLVPITFDVTIDEFFEVGATEVETGVPSTGPNN